jgi:DNA polymerase alpha subunit A
LYAFEHADVPDRAEYLEVHYSAKYPALPSDLLGETFSRVFGTNQSSLEHFLISRRIRGPCWLDIRLPAPSSPPTSWCKVEAICEEPNNVAVLLSNPPSPPPLTILAMNMKTTINPKTMLNEISLVSCLVHNEFFLDKAAPKVPFQMHFCAMTRPSDEVWPFDLQKVMGNYTAGDGPKIDRMDTERMLLGFVLARIGKIDPDIIIGHDITGFDLDVLLHRTVLNKIPHWSRLGRLKRSQPPNFRGRLSEKEAVTGRLVCDLKISAKELIRCKVICRKKLGNICLHCSGFQELRLGRTGGEAAGEANRPEDRGHL